MRVLELLASGRWSGPAEPMASVARELARRGHVVELAVDTDPQHTLAQELRERGFTVRDDLSLSTKAGALAFLRDLRRLSALAPGFDILHANFSHDHLLALLALWRRGPRRVVRTIHSSRSLEPRAAQGY